MENFNLYKQMEEKLETIPTVKAEMHFTINDAAQKNANAESISPEDLNALEMVFEEMQDLERELVTLLDDYRSHEVITSEEFLLVTDYFLVAHQQGPDSRELKSLLMDVHGNNEAFEGALQATSIPQHTKVLLQTVYGKIKA